MQGRWMFPLLALILLGADAQVDEQRERLASLPGPSQDKVRAAWNTFQNLPESERDQLRHLRQQIDAEPSLRETMDEYLAWRDSLPPVQQAELDAAKPEERLAVLRRLLNEQERQNREDMAKFRQHSPTRTRKMPRGYDPNFPNLFLNYFRATLKSQATESEFNALTNMPTDRAEIFALVLLEKYQIVMPDFARRLGNGRMNELLKLYRAVTKMSGAESYEILSAGERKRVIDWLVAFLIVPPIDEEKRNTFVEENKNSPEINSIKNNENSMIRFQLMTFLYYKRRPWSIPDHYRKDVELVLSEISGTVMERGMRPPLDRMREGKPLFAEPMGEPREKSFMDRPKLKDLMPFRKGPRGENGPPPPPRNENGQSEPPPRPGFPKGRMEKSGPPPRAP